MSFVTDVSDEIHAIAVGTWGDIPTGRVVPEVDKLVLAGNNGIRLDATMLYADLADSTKLAMHSQTIAAEVYEAYRDRRRAN